MSDLLEQVKSGKQVDVYLCQNIKYGFVNFTASSLPDGEHVILGKGKVIISMKSNDEIIEQALELYDSQIKKSYAEAEIKVSEIKEAKARFLSLTYQEV